MKKSLLLLLFPICSIAGQYDDEGLRRMERESEQNYQAIMQQQNYNMQAREARAMEQQQLMQQQLMQQQQQLNQPYDWRRR